MQNRSKRQKINDSVTVPVKRAPKVVNNNQEVPDDANGAYRMKECRVKLKRVELADFSVISRPAPVKRRREEVCLLKDSDDDVVPPLDVVDDVATNNKGPRSGQPQRLSLRRKSIAAERASEAQHATAIEDVASDTASSSKSAPVELVEPQRLSLRRKSIAAERASETQHATAIEDVASDTASPSKSSHVELVEPQRLSLRRKSIAAVRASEAQHATAIHDMASNTSSPSKSSPVELVFSPESNSADVWKKCSLRLSLRRKSTAEPKEIAAQNNCKKSSVPLAVESHTGDGKSEQVSRTASPNRSQRVANKRAKKDETAVVEAVPAKRPMLGNPQIASTSTAKNYQLKKCVVRLKRMQEVSAKKCAIKLKRVNETPKVWAKSKPIYRQKAKEAPTKLQELPDNDKPTARPKVPAPTSEKLPDNSKPQAPADGPTSQKLPEKVPAAQPQMPPLNSKPTYRQKLPSRQPVSRKSPDIFSEDNDDPANLSDIYAFNTQSSTAEDEHEDIAADIIAKMKKENRICIARHKRNITRPNGIKKKTNASSTLWSQLIKNNTAGKMAPQENLQKKKSKPAAKKAPAKRPGTSKSKAQANRTAPSTSAGVNRRTQNVRPNQTARASPLSKPKPPQRHGLDKSRLLLFAKEFVGTSTPNKVLPKPPSATNRPDLTPISAPPPPPLPSPDVDTQPPQLDSPPTSTSAAPSPWRVNDEIHIPRTFYFSRATDQLPSYSSDVVPSSQQDVVARKDRTSLEKSATPLSRAPLSTTSIPHISPLKSFDENRLNISNIENISPVKPLGEKNSDKSALIGANPRRGLIERSPLKPINILNVVTLPNRANVQSMRSTLHMHSIRDKENAGENIVSVSPSKTHSKPSSKQSKNNAFNESVETSAHISFGFSDDEISLEEDDAVKPLPPSMLPNKRRLTQRLHKLKRLLPPKPTRISVGTIRSIFRSPTKQKDIREMLSSTRNASMMTLNDDTLAGTSRIEKDVDDMSHVENEDESNMDTDVHLFDDPEEPQTSLSTTAQLRTYQRPNRKTKRVKNFLLFASDSEDDEKEVEHAAKPKRSRPTKHDKELNKFAKEFNSMCEDVDRYELVVERSKDFTV